jgi:hypothetical protein
MLWFDRIVSDVRADVDLSMAHLSPARLSPRAKVAGGPDNPNRLAEDPRSWHENPLYRRFIVDTAFPLW